MSKNYDIKALDEMLEKMYGESGFTGLSVAVRGDDGIIYKRGFGHRRMDPELPVDENTVFGIASMSKSFSTLALAILATEGKVDFDEPVSKYFPNFKVPGLPASAVTIRHLAMHTTGIPPIQPLEWSIAMNSTERDNQWSRNMRAASPNKMETIDQIIDYIAAGDYQVPGYTTLGHPGEYMSYSNEGYAILSYLVDKVSGTTLEEFLKERVFGPLEMTRTILDLDGSEIREIAASNDVTGSIDHNVSALFEKDEEGKLVWDDHYSILPPFRACACIKSTAEDLTHYYKCLADWGSWNGKQVIPAEAVELMIGSSFPLGPIKQYCYGLNKRIMADRIICEHSGGLHGVSTMGAVILSDPASGKEGFSVVTLCNDGDVEPEEFNWTCSNMLLGLPLETKHRIGWEPIEEDFSDPEMLVGDYVVAEGETQHFILKYDRGAADAEGSATEGSDASGSGSADNSGGGAATDGCADRSASTAPAKPGISYDVPTLHGDFRGTDVVLKYCGGTRFEAFDEKEPDKRVYPMEFFIKDGQAYYVRCGSRVYQRAK